MRRTHLIRAAYLAGAAVLASVAVSAVVVPVYGGHAFVQCVEMLAPIGITTTLVADWLSRRRAWLGGLRRQVAGLAVLTFVQLALAVGLFAGMMFVSSHDAFFTALIACYAGPVRLGAARRMRGPRAHQR